MPGSLYFMPLVKCHHNYVAFEFRVADKIHQIGIYFKS